MLKREVLKYFGNKPSAVARALGINRAAVSQWGSIIPKASAYDLDRITSGALKFRPELYQRRNRTTPIPAARTG